MTLGHRSRLQLRDRIVRELPTTSATRYSAQIYMAEALQPETLVKYARPTTGQKYLITLQ